MFKKLSLYLYFCTSLLSLNVSQAAADDGWSDVFKFQTKMAEMGSSKAQFILGEMYEEGRGVKRNLNTAIKWYSEAQKNGHTGTAARITNIKNKISQANLKKKIIANKALQLQTKKKIKPVSMKAPKPIIKNHEKILQTKSALETKNIKKTPTNPLSRKQHTSPEDFSRGNGTHLDEYEDPFE